ncbi:hypothetical protein K435DRAFT_557245, partial [Dendrothele bispora CBS 962.96]
LIGWVAVNERGIEHLFIYVDDSYGFHPAGDLEYYAPYDGWYPAPQVKLLQLWDELGIPHGKPKQVYGLVMTTIGFEVDPNEMFARMPTEAKSELVQAIRQFVTFPPCGKLRHSLVDFMRMASWVNWSFNVHPLLKPGLCQMYQKMRGKEKIFAQVAVSRALRDEMLWLADRLERSNGVYFFESYDWELSEADVVTYCDASLIG